MSSSEQTAESISDIESWPGDFMIYTLRIECVFGHFLEEQCIRVIEIEDDSSLYDLHEAIQDAMAFGRDHPFTFYTANMPFGLKRTWLSEADEWEDRESDFLRIQIKEIWPLGRRRLYYWFDFGDRWTFEIRKRRGVKPPQPGVRYPRIVESIGPNPVQYPSFEE